MIKLILAPIRSIVRFPLLQLAIVIAVILWLQAADDRSIFGQIFIPSWYVAPIPRRKRHGNYRAVTADLGI
jgi:hypothetical protein